MKYVFIKILKSKTVYAFLGVISLISISSALVSASHVENIRKHTTNLENKFQATTKELNTVKADDQYKKNKKLNEEIQNIHNSYKKTVSLYENILNIKPSKKTEEYDKLFASALQSLSERNYASAQSTLTLLESQLKKEQETNASISITVAKNTPVTASNTAPSNGYSRQNVTSEIGNFTVDIIAGDLSNTKVIVDTASDSDCHDNCPVLSLSDYVSRNGAYAGINGSYFCPTSYPSCAGKTNSFDTLLMNKNKHYFNSDNNVYSTVPAVIFGPGWVRFVGKSLDWGRDTTVDGVLANQPLLVSGGNVVFGGDGDPKKGGKGSRSFVAAKGNVVYIGVVHNATVAEVAHVLKSMGMEHALNLDSGGSTALWHGGYKAGPGRSIPNAILFVRK